MWAIIERTAGETDKLVDQHGSYVRADIVCCERAERLLTDATTYRIGAVTTALDAAGVERLRQQCGEIVVLNFNPNTGERRVAILTPTVFGRKHTKRGA